MSEWGLVGFHYDYTEELTDFEKQLTGEETKRICGLVVKAYKYPGIPGVIMHGFNAMRFFLEHKDDYDFNRDVLNTAMDVFFEYREIQTGIDTVSIAYSKKAVIDDNEINENLFSCEGSHGYMYIDYTGNPEDGYTMKYSTYVHGEVMDIRSFAESSAKGIETGITTDSVRDYLFECVDDIEETAKFMTEDEWEKFIQASTDWIQEQWILDDSTE